MKPEPAAVRERQTHFRDDRPGHQRRCHRRQPPSVRQPIRRCLRRRRDHRHLARRHASPLSWRRDGHSPRLLQSRLTFNAVTLNLLQAVNRIELMATQGRGLSEFARDRRFRGHDRPETRKKHPRRNLGKQARISRFNPIRTGHSPSIWRHRDHRPFRSFNGAPPLPSQRWSVGAFAPTPCRASATTSLPTGGHCSHLGVGLGAIFSATSRPAPPAACAECSIRIRSAGRHPAASSRAPCGLRHA